MQRRKILKFTKPITLAILMISSAVVVLLVSGIATEFPFTTLDRTERKIENDVLVGAHIPGYRPLKSSDGQILDPIFPSNYTVGNVQYSNEKDMIVVAA